MLGVLVVLNVLLLHATVKYARFCRRYKFWAEKALRMLPEVPDAMSITWQMRAVLLFGMQSQARLLRAMRFVFIALTTFVVGELWKTLLFPL